MPLPYQIATLLYCFNAADEVLLLERTREPNRGLWSPPGGKLHMHEGESPHACAIREAYEELGLMLESSNVRLTGIVSEHGYQGQSHWLMFLFEVQPKLQALPPSIQEGRFAFFPRAALEDLPMPQTDREQIWPLFWQHRGGFFVAHYHCGADGRCDWILQQSSLRPPLHAPLSNITSARA